MAKNTTFALVDGKVTEVKTLTAKEAAEVQREPLVRNALNVLTGNNNPDLVNWLFTKRSDILATYDTGTVRRVTKAERKALTAALKHVSEELANDPKAKFVVENANAIAETFKWPGQKRVAEEDRAAAIQEAFMELTGDNEKLVTFLLNSKDALEAAYNTGIVKREVSQKTLDALAKHHADRKAAKEAAEAQG